MAKHGKKYRQDLEKLDRDRDYPLPDAIELVKSFHDLKFDQSVELNLSLGIDPRQADQAIRGSISLPHGIGQSKRVIAFCPNDKVEAAKEAGAIEAGGEDLVKKIEDGWMEFDVAVATPDMMRVISKLGRVLGPRGLMPSPKAGTVTQDVAQAVTEYAAGKVEFRNDSGGNMHVIIGKKSFGTKELQDNAEFFLDALRKMRPSTTKGHFIEKCSVAATMTPGVTVAV